MPKYSDAYVIHDGTIIHEASSDFCDLFNCPTDEVVGRHIADIIASPDLRELAMLRGRHIMQTEERDEFLQPYDFKRCDGSHFWGEAISQRQDDGKYKTRIVWHYEISRW